MSAISPFPTVLKLLKMAKGIRSLLDTVMQALPQVGNLGLLFYLLFFIFAALGVELFGRLGNYTKNFSSPKSKSFFLSLVHQLIILFRIYKNVTMNTRARGLANMRILPILELHF